jgi:hypothetical protein
MLKKTQLCTMAIVCTLIGIQNVPVPAVAATPETPAASTPTLGPAETAGVDDAFEFAGNAPAPVAAPPSQALLREIVDWLAENFGLPATDRLPRVELVPQARIVATRYRRFLEKSPQAAREILATLKAGNDTVAIYDDDSSTIYLAEWWSPSSPAQISILVHEMVHHLQKIGLHKFECPPAREKLAYQAQERWLQRFDRSLEADFEIDPFTLMIRTSCGM